MDRSFLQSSLWASFKSAFGWKSHFFEYEGEKLSVLVRRFGKLFSLAYIPYAPVGDSDLKELSGFLKKKLPAGCIFIRYDLPRFVEKEGAWSSDNKVPDGFYKASLDIQPPSSVQLDLTLSEAELLKGMKDRARRNIRTAEKRGVKVEVCGVDKLPLWYDLYRETAERDRISIHGFNYYQKLFLLAEEQKEIDVRLYLASVEDDVIAGIITVFNGNEAVYLYGASCGRKRETMPAYALQWQAIRDAKASGCTFYDFFGIPPAPDENHPMYGLYCFKTGFGGHIIHRPGCWDYPCRPVLYRMYRLAEAARRYYYKTFRKKH